MTTEFTITDRLRMSVSHSYLWTMLNMIALPNLKESLFSYKSSWISKHTHSYSSPEDIFYNRKWTGTDFHPLQTYAASAAFIAGGRYSLLLIVH